MSFGVLGRKFDRDDVVKDGELGYQKNTFPSSFPIQVISWPL